MEKKSMKPLQEGLMKALSALCDTLLPTIDVSDDAHHQPLDQSVLQFYQTSASMANTPHNVAVFIWEKIKHPKIIFAKMAIWLLSTRIGTFLLCGRKSISVKFPYLLRFCEVPLEKREQILQSWSNSHIFLLRLFFCALKIFTLLTFFTQVNEKNSNPSWKAIGYVGPDPTHTQKKGQEQEQDDPSKEEFFGPLHKGIINFQEWPKQRALNKLQNLGFPISKSHSTKARSGPCNPSFVINCDVVVVGSGSGGGLVAGLLAKVGYRVLVLEKGKYFARSNLSLLEGKALDQMYLGNGLIGTKNMDVLLLAGSTVGGGSTINWLASIQTPPHVMEEWSKNHGLKLFESREYKQALDIVCKKMGVMTKIEDEGFNNMVLRKGCQNLGHPVENVPQNAPPNHNCGWCCLGCKDGSKKGVSETWLVDLVESGNGAILPGCEVLKVITHPTHGRKRAVGIAFEFQGPITEDIGIVEAQVTVAACGAICTPGLLQRSGLRNSNIGRNLHVHPVTMAWGHFPNAPKLKVWPEARKRSYEGNIISAMSRVTTNDDTSHGYSAIIQTPSLHPGIFSILTPWKSGKDFKLKMLKFSRTAHLFALARDKGTGVVNTEQDISYALANLDKKNLKRGIDRMLRILAAAGAEEIGTQHQNGRVLRVKEASREEFESFVKEESSRVLEGLSTPICSAHQMGSCRMGVDPKKSVVGPTGETWEVESLYIADSSVFPTALGVNPMVTVQAIAYCIGKEILNVVGRGKF